MTITNHQKLSLFLKLTFTLHLLQNILKDIVNLQTDTSDYLSEEEFSGYYCIGNDDCNYVVGVPPVMNEHVKFSFCLSSYVCKYPLVFFVNVIVSKPKTLQ